MGALKSGESVTTTRRRKSKCALVRRALENIEDKLESNDVKATIGDFIRLLQLEKELEGEQIRDIRVTWVEPKETQPSGR